MIACILCLVPCIFISMYIKIFFKDKPLFLCDTIDETIQPFIHHDDAVFIDELNAHTVKTMIHEMQQPQVHAGIFYHSDLEELKKNEENKILMIFRRGKWDLPKGKLDGGEKLEDCAIREVEEETGLKNVKLHSPLTVTYHTYHEGTKYILKQSHWFMMSVTGDQQTIPQTDEDIFEIHWVEQTNINDYLSKAFPLISDIIKAAKL